MVDALTWHACESFQVDILACPPPGSWDRAHQVIVTLVKLQFRLGPSPVDEQSEHDGRSGSANWEVINTIWHFTRPLKIPHAEICSELLKAAEAGLIHALSCLDQSF
jgi:hypothetical protein